MVSSQVALISYQFRILQNSVLPIWKLQGHSHGNMNAEFSDMDEHVRVNIWSTTIIIAVI